MFFPRHSEARYFPMFFEPCRLILFTRGTVKRVKPGRASLYQCLQLMVYPGIGPWAIPIRAACATRAFLLCWYIQSALADILPLLGSEDGQLQTL